ncbi:NAD(P)-dependent oxidoreductase [Sphingomonas sp.]|uniref:NAD(P)-dependent oxidoreductase n=1 Tax=Sphingomonas sp. TaxID=28214 RepID=UPI0038AC5EA0
MRIGFIGLGHMGRGMAGSLIKSGHEVTVFNRTPGKSADLEAAGAKVAADVGEACDGDAVVTMLSNDEAVESVVFGRLGIIDSLRKGAVHVSSSTISIDLSDRLAAAHADAGQGYVAATVLGRPNLAAEGQLFVIAAGADEAVNAVAPLLSAVGRQTTRFGVKPSNANMVKLSVNFLFASVMESLGEAVALVAKGGIDKADYVEFLTTTMFNAPAYKTYGELAVSEQPAPVGFAAPLGFKDIRLAIAASEKLGVPMPLLSLLHDRFVELMASGGEHMDWSAIGKLAQRDAGMLDLAA